MRDLESCELVAVNRSRAELAEAFAKEFGARRWYRDWRELIADSEIDAVYIATPVYLHAEQTIAAAEAGKVGSLFIVNRLTGKLIRKALAARYRRPE